MAHIQEYLEQSEPYTSSLLSRSRFLYDLGSSAAICPEVSIAPPVLASTVGDSQLASTDYRSAESVQSRKPHVTIAVVNAADTNIEHLDAHKQFSVGTAARQRR